MAKKMLAPEHKKFFQINGYIAFDQLITAEAVEALVKLIEQQRVEMPGLALENLAGRLPALQAMAKQLSYVAAGLLERKPIWLKCDRYLQAPDNMEIEEREVALVIDAKGRATFSILPEHLYKESSPCYLLFVYTANNQNTPILFK